MSPVDSDLASSFATVNFPQDQLVGVAVFSMPMSSKVLTNIFPCDVLEAVELGRFVLLDNVPSNAESWFFARCRELLKREGIKGIVAFSDDTPRTSIFPVPSLIFSGHIGTIYQSSNAVYLKRTTPRVLQGTTEMDLYLVTGQPRKFARQIVAGDMPQTFLSKTALPNHHQLTRPIPQF